MKTVFTPILLLVAVATSRAFAQRDENGFDLDKIAVRVILDGKGGGNGKESAQDKSNIHGYTNGKDNGDNKGKGFGKANNNGAINGNGNGKSASGNAFCTDAEHDTLAAAFVNVIHDMDQRQLRAGRNAQYSRQSCRTLCSGFVRSHCYLVFPRCDGRYLASTNDEAGSPPRLLENNVSIAVSNKCGRMKKSIEKEIDTILSQELGLVSEPCMNLLGMGYSVSCAYMEDDDN